MFGLRKWQVAIVLIILGTMVPVAPRAQNTDPIPLADRAWMASKMYAAVQRYFGHWQAIPEYDLNAAYRTYLAEVLASPDRRAFSLASMAFLATLKNGHTNFSDSRLFASPPTGLDVRRLGQDWVVASSQREEISAGDVIEAVDGTPVADFVRERVRYAHGSNARVREQRVFRMPYLLPERFVVRLRGGREVDVVRGEGLGPAPASRTLEGRVLDGGVPYIVVPSFGRQSFETQAVALLKAHATAPAMIIDVRGNGGGTTPTSLIEALMDRPYQGWTEATMVSNALFGAYRGIEESSTRAQLGEYNAGYVDGLASFDRAVLSTLGGVVQPGTPIFTGRLIVLIDGRCASACEDFVMPLKLSGRATLVGEATQGSTGQPYMHDFGDGLSFRISTKRVYFPDGRTFEGVGVEPDVEVIPTPADFRAGRDVALQRALALASSSSVPAAAVRR